MRNQREKLEKFGWQVEKVETAISDKNFEA